MGCGGLFLTRDLGLLESTPEWGTSILTSDDHFTPMHRAFDIEEIIEAICGWLSPKDLATLMCSSRLFQDVSRRVMWREHANLLSVLYALPSVLLELRDNGILVNPCSFSKSPVLTFVIEIQEAAKGGGLGSSERLDETYSNTRSTTTQTR